MATIGVNLKELRLKYNMTQDTLSKLSGVPRSCISAYERNKMEPKTPYLAQLAHTLKVSVSKLDENLANTEGKILIEETQGYFVSDSMELTLIDYFRKFNTDEKVKCLNCMREKKFCDNGKESSGGSGHHENRDQKTA
jgi:transcriptional regulator with XRE-family HTH domain